MAHACFLCKRTDPIAHGTYVRVSWPDGSVKDVCDDCYAKSDWDQRMDMGEDDE